MMDGGLLYRHPVNGEVRRNSIYLVDTDKPKTWLALPCILISTLAEYVGYEDDDG